VTIIFESLFIFTYGLLWLIDLLAPIVGKCREKMNTSAPLPGPQELVVKQKLVNDHEKMLQLYFIPILEELNYFEI
jgi:hypothetical protein